MKNKCPRGPASSNSVAVKNKPARVLLLRLHSTQHLLAANRVGLHFSKSCWVKTPLGNFCTTYQSIIQKLRFKKQIIPKFDKDRDNNTATQLKGHSTRLPPSARDCGGCTSAGSVAPPMRVPLSCHQVKPVRRVTAPEPSADDCCTQSSKLSAQPTQAGDLESVTSSVSAIIRHSKI